VLDDVVARRIPVAGEQRRRLHDLSRLAVAALRYLLGDPGFLQRMACLLVAAPSSNGVNVVFRTMVGRVNPMQFAGLAPRLHSRA
jgi:hypothetical protein